MTEAGGEYRVNILTLLIPAYFLHHHYRIIILGNRLTAKLPSLSLVSVTAWLLTPGVYSLTYLS